MGRSRGGPTTKIHALVDAAERPIVLKLTEGQRQDGKAAPDMLDDLGPGQTLLAEQGAFANVKPMPNRKTIAVFSKFLYKRRNLVERFFNEIKHFRAAATRYDKSPENCLASVKLAAMRIWLRGHESTA